ncbi:hypothetical protein [Nocardia sp. NPDC050717]|uniref:hypothetical protein n=1 Tax=Nocardia sp. NPDC050717 TaxID=3157221 RepID=UPI0033ECC2D3
MVDELCCARGEVVIGEHALRQPGHRQQDPAEIEVFAGAGHGIFHQVPDRVTERVLDFTRRYEPTDARRGE